MFGQWTISQEMLAIGAKSKIGPIVEKYVAEIRDYLKTNQYMSQEIFKRFSAELKKETGISYAFEVDSSPGLDMAVSSQMNVLGHSGTWYNSYDWLRAENFYNEPTKMVSTVDLKNVRVSGGLSDKLVFTIHMSMGFLTEKLGFTIREVTAAIIHEIGHSFSIFMYMGDYVWLNYYLTDGLEILQGKKRNVYNLEILSEKWLQDNLLPEQWEAFSNERTEEAAKRAILSTYKKAPRHHLVNNPVTAMRREEQMADMFSTRLGYGRDLVTCMHKFNKYYGMLDSDTTFVIKLIHALGFIIFSPLIILIILGGSPVNEFDFAARYDNPYERMLKVRKDLIAQLRRTTSAELKAGMNEDIKAIDAIISDFSNNRHFFNTLSEILRPARRREAQYTKVEEDLEGLLNNDLFLQAFRINQVKV